MPLTDCAPLVMAQELGLFKKFGLNVVLNRELGWATIRDKVIYGELDAVHAVAGMPFAATLARREYVGASEMALRRGLSGEFDFGHDLTRTVPDFTIFSRDDANEPDGKKAAWVIQHLRDSGLCKDASALTFALGKKVFRADIFNKAKEISRKEREGRKGFENKNSFAAFAPVA